MAKSSACVDGGMSERVCMHDMWREDPLRHKQNLKLNSSCKNNCKSVSNKLTNHTFWLQKAYQAMLVNIQESSSHFILDCFLYTAECQTESVQSG